MVNPVKLIYMAQEREEGNPTTIKKNDKWAAVLELVLYTFVVNFIMELVRMGDQIPTLSQLYYPFLGSVLMALLIYGRARGLDVSVDDDE